MKDGNYLSSPSVKVIATLLTRGMEKNAEGESLNIPYHYCQNSYCSLQYDNDILSFALKDY